MTDENGADIPDEHNELEEERVVDPSGADPEPDSLVYLHQEKATKPRGTAPKKGASRKAKRKR